MLLIVGFGLMLIINLFHSVVTSGSSGYYAVTTEAASGPRHILSLSSDEKCKFLDSFDYVFSDIDGVVWVLEHDIEGAAAGFKELKAAGKKLTFITNNSVRPAKSYAKKFKVLDLDVDVNEIIHPAKSIVDYLKSIKFDGLIYVIASEAFKDVLRAAGYKFIDGPNKIIEESFEVLASNVFDNESVDAVIIDVDFNLSSMKLIRAHVYLRNPKCLLIAGATDMLLPLRKDASIIGPGAFASTIAVSSKKKMITLGKPGKELAQMLVKRFNIKDTKRVLMIGDMLDQDVAFGRECGFQTLIVMSGGCAHEDLATANFLPHYCAESMGDFVQFMRDIKEST